jgi:hypothetical protein
MGGKICYRNQQQPVFFWGWVGLSLFVWFWFPGPALLAGLPWTFDLI